MVWFASSACFSSALKSSSPKTAHHSPLATPSFGALSRQGSATSHLAGTGAVARWYFGPAVQPHGTVHAAGPSSAGNRTACHITGLMSALPPAEPATADRAHA